ncbi:hypothetical protein KORDIASMS9_01547 [Kordia sp. SMS9]|uniref:hypothetical protein n=1 Tax=Kordia sp. SMS9 TaxID=2282170 RepID=UPI000E0D2B40|nr:hypothetical protein [Kordia sp. SMS9]AXG69327.1 hypothetical protein KORDIASMS9_01547 [Kordia sp. SMS9]
MGFFEKLFGSKKLKTTDADFGAIESFSKRGTDIGWQVNQEFLGFPIEILIAGDANGIVSHQKQILLDALQQETSIKTEAENALKEQFDNAEMEFISLEKHFHTRGMSVNDTGFELTFQEKATPNYFFNVHFENNKQVGVVIDG